MCEQKNCKRMAAKGVTQGRGQLPHRFDVAANQQAAWCCRDAECCVHTAPRVLHIATSHVQALELLAQETSLCLHTLQQHRSGYTPAAAAIAASFVFF